MKELRAKLDKVAAWAKKHNRPVFLGEFGAYHKADMTSRVNPLQMPHATDPTITPMAARSRMLSRVCSRRHRSLAQLPAASGPRRRMEARTCSMTAVSAVGPPKTPAMPHTGGDSSQDGRGDARYHAAGHRWGQIPRSKTPRR